jgi:DNA-binding beta-propeller fold protein YncE
MKKYLVVYPLWLLSCAVLFAQEIPHPTELLGQAFQVKTIWTIDGADTWDFVKFDAAYRQLYIPHGNVVQAVDVETGSVTGEIRAVAIRGTTSTRAIALDDRDEFGYISDSAGHDLVVFDRRTLKVVARVPTAANPRALVYEPISGLVFVICGQLQRDATSPPDHALSPTNSQSQIGAQQVSFEPGSYTQEYVETYYVRTSKGRVLRKRPSNKPSAPADPNAVSVITVVDAETWTPRATLLVRGRAGFAEADGQGRVFINIVDQGSIVRLEAQGIRDLLDREKPIREEDLKYGRNRFTSIADDASLPLAYMNVDTYQALVSNMFLLNWGNISPQTRPPDALYRAFPLAAECNEPQGLTIDGPHLRLFVACSDNKLAVVNADSGHLVANVPTGPGTGVIEFDGNHGLIFAANGGSGGTLTIIRQHVVDSYEVVANLPTARRARVLAVNSVSGEIYVVTDAGNSALDVLVVGH